MKLLTHNMLTSHIKGVKNGYPLKILVRQCDITICCVTDSSVVLASLSSSPALHPITHRQLLSAGHVW